MDRAECLSPLNDPLLLTTDLPLLASWNPLGFPLQVATNHPAVLAAAEESWRLFPQAYDKPPLQLRMAVAQGTDDSLPVPVFRAQGHLTSIIGNAENFAVCDYTRSFGFGWMTPAVVEYRNWFRWYFLDSLVYTLLDQLYLTTVHAACVARNGCGVLLCGESGAGKSTLSFACALRGWTFLSDDGTSLVRHREDHAVIGNPHRFHFRDTAAAIFPEMRGRLATPKLNGKLTIEVPTSELPGVPLAYECNVRHIVFLRRDGRRRAALSPLDGGTALEYLMRDRPLFDRPVHEEQVISLRRLTGMPCFELRYGDLDSAVNELDSLVT
jgi:hypothetical protein